jgi:hypothetical protein
MRQRTFLQNVFHSLKEKYLIWKQRRAFNKAKKIADLKHEFTGKKQAVMLDYDGSYAVFSRSEFLLMRRRGRFDKTYKWEDVLKEANYLTR